MKSITDEVIKNIEFEILRDVAQFCEKSNIRYFLACGTALGAVRHDGFIPWDDDIDIAMPRPDYDNFIKSYKSNKFELLAMEFDDKYPYPFAKVSDKTTNLVEKISNPFPMGVYIDVFPIDGLPESEHERKRHLKLIENDARVLAWKRISSGKKVGYIHKLIQIIAKFFLLPVPISVLVKKYDKDVRKYAYDKENFVGHLITKATWGSDVKPKKIFDTYTLHTFEGCEFRLPVEYDKYLTIEYGDYMKLPPVEKQVKKHDFTVEWK